MQIIIHYKQFDHYKSRKSRLLTSVLKMDGMRHRNDKLWQEGHNEEFCLDRVLRSAAITKKVMVEIDHVKYEFNISGVVNFNHDGEAELLCVQILVDPSRKGMVILRSDGQKIVKHKEHSFATRFVKGVLQLIKCRLKMPSNCKVHQLGITDPVECEDLYKTHFYIHGPEVYPKVQAEVILGKQVCFFEISWKKGTRFTVDFEGPTQPGSGCKK